MPKTIWGGKIDGRTKIGKNVAMFDGFWSLVFLPFKLAFFLISLPFKLIAWIFSSAK